MGRATGELGCRSLSHHRGGTLTRKLTKLNGKRQPPRSCGGCGKERGRKTFIGVRLSSPLSVPFFFFFASVSGLLTFLGFCFWSFCRFSAFLVLACLVPVYIFVSILRPAGKRVRSVCMCACTCTEERGEGGDAGRLMDHPWAMGDR